jgi:2,2-dialkylglycine decarboxylase (pyruvate)
VVALTRSWHGVTAGASAHTHAGGRRGHGPATPGAFAIPAPYEYRCPIRHCDGSCDCSCLEAGFDLFDQASVGAPAAVLAEPVLSAGGVIVPPPGYFVRMAELCAERDMLLVLDECQTGLGRLGTMYGFELYDVVPDFLALSKTLGGGVPVSAVVTTPDIEERCFEMGFTHVTSHVSDPMPAAVAEAVLDVVISDDLPGAARARGDRLITSLRELQTRHESIGDVRGMGLLVGMELVEDRDTRAPADALGRALTEECLRCGLSMNLVRGQSAGSANCLRMAPPLTVSDDEIDLAVTVIDEALTTVTSDLAVR